jgi:hypothetical protein
MFLALLALHKWRRAFEIGRVKRTAADCTHACLLEFVRARVCVGMLRASYAYHGETRSRNYVGCKEKVEHDGLKQTS